jgi:chromosome segregation ATPase
VLSAVDSSSATLYAGLAGLVGVILTVGIQQWNKRRDAKQTERNKDISARVADTEAALDAWNRINEFQAKQIKELTERVNDLEKKAKGYEDIAAELQKIIDGLRVELNQKQATIDEQQRHVTQLLDKIEALNAQISTLQIGGTT